ncbi:MAG: bacterioferritin-associated ferredoxin [Rhodothermia bacterium]
MILIYRCVCFNRTFSELKQAAEDADADSVHELLEHVTFGSNCGLCLPYVERMLSTGETTFSEVIDQPVIRHQTAVSGDTVTRYPVPSTR